MVVKGKEGEGIVRESGMDMDTLLCLTWKTSKELLDSTGNSAPCHVAAWMGGEFAGEGILVYGRLSPPAARSRSSAPAKVMRKEAGHTQRRDRASGVPLEILEHLPPKPESAYFLLCALTYTSNFTGGCPPLPLSEKRVHLQLQLIKFLGVIVFQPTNSFGSPLACLNRFFWPHVIAQSLPTVRSMRCSKLSK